MGSDHWPKTSEMLQFLILGIDQLEAFSIWSQNPALGHVICLQLELESEKKLAPLHHRHPIRRALSARFVFVPIFAWLPR